MSRFLKHYLPVVAVIGALVAAASIVLGAGTREQTLVDTGETRASVEDTLAVIQSTTPASIDDASLHRALVNTEHAPYVSTVWLFTPDGKILAGNQAFSKGNVQDSATAETRRILETLPEDSLSHEQAIALLAASVMQAEGEHNDVFRHVLRPVRDAGGQVVALVGLTYDVSPSIGALPGIATMLLAACALAGLGVYWLALPLWVWLDARDRGERAWVWGTFVLIGNLVGLITYLLTRR
ncbi:MAG: hypothetical protein MUQ10_13095, partial [Anaerolineae bacterium]|nr:hypothetical protein [Anaerolineae bacterium]